MESEDEFRPKYVEFLTDLLFTRCIDRYKCFINGFLMSKLVRKYQNLVHYIVFNANLVVKCCIYI